MEETHLSYEVISSAGPGTPSNPTGESFCSPGAEGALGESQPVLGRGSLTLASPPLHGCHPPYLSPHQDPETYSQPPHWTASSPSPPTCCQRNAPSANSQPPSHWASCTSSLITRLALLFACHLPHQSCGQGPCLIHLIHSRV